MQHHRSYGYSKLCLAVLCWLLAIPLPAFAHLGVQNVLFETQAGNYPLRVTIKPPQVVPGLAEIFVRVHEGDIQRITALPVRYDTGREGAPPPDEAIPVVGEPNLFQAELWFMQSGAYSVIIDVQGDRGGGEVMVPFNAIATRTLPMPGFLSALLVALAALLILLAASIAGAAVRHAVLPPNETPSRRRIWGARTVTVVQLALVLFLVSLGKQWWDAEELEYRNNRLYEPMAMEASLEPQRPSELAVKISDPRFRRGSPLLPDHGKLMHLFVIDESLNSFAHLHPTRTAWDVFKTELPEFPAGDYRIFADITHETGFSHTLTNRVSLAGPSSRGFEPATYRDPDDSWSTSSNESAPYSVKHLSSEPYRANQEIELRFSVRDASNQTAPLEPYMGMKSHLVLYKNDGTVFSHLHPSGTISMASLQAFETRITGGRPPQIAYGQIDPFCEIPSVADSTERWWQWEKSVSGADLVFPYAFPSAGEYRIWVQVKIDGSVHTKAFDVTVTP